MIQVPMGVPALAEWLTAYATAQPPAEVIAGQGAAQPVVWPPVLPAGQIVALYLFWLPAGWAAPPPADPETWLQDARVGAVWISIFERTDSLTAVQVRAYGDSMAYEAQRLHQALLNYVPAPQNRRGRPAGTHRYEDRRHFEELVTVTIRALLLGNSRVVPSQERVAECLGISPNTLTETLGRLELNWTALLRQGGYPPAN